MFVDTFAPSSKYEFYIKFEIARFDPAPNGNVASGSNTGGTGTGGTDTGAGYTGGSGGTGGTTNGNSNPWGYIQPPVAVLPLDQYITDIKASIRNCLGSYILDNGNTTVNEWLDNTDFSIGTNFINLKRLESFLNAMPTRGNLEAPTGEPNCSNPQAQAFAVQAIEAFENGGEVDFDELILLDPEIIGTNIECVYNKLKNGNTTIRGYLNNFEGDLPVSHLSFSIDIAVPLNDQQAIAITYPPNNYVINIKFNGVDTPTSNYYGNFPHLMIALTLIHETVHAEMFRKMLSVAQLGDLQIGNMTQAEQVSYVQGLADNFEGIWDYYVDRWTPNWGHNMLAQHYRNIIATALADYDNNQHSPLFYQDMAWVGLKGTIPWNHLTTSEKNRINLTIDNFKQNGPINCQ